MAFRGGRRRGRLATVLQIAFLGSILGVLGFPYLVGVAIAWADLLGFITNAQAADFLERIVGWAFGRLGVEGSVDTARPARTYALLSAYGALLTIIVLIATAIVARSEYAIAKDTQVRVKTLDYVSKINEDRDVIQMFAQFRYVRDKYDDDITYADIRSDYDRHKADYQRMRDEGEYEDYAPHDYDYILQLLNIYETWAIGILNGALDHGMLKDWWRESFVRHWISLASFVGEYRARRGGEEAYEHMERLAKRWMTRAETAELAGRRKRDRRLRRVETPPEDDRGVVPIGAARRAA